MRNTTINPISEQDVPYITKIMQNRWEYPHEKALEEVRAHLVQNKEMGGFCVHNEHREPVGVGLFSIYNEDVSTKYSPWMYLLWIEPEYRGNDLGILLTQKRMDYARSHGYREVYIDTVDAIPYHHTLGWKDIEIVSRNGEKITIMRWDLSESFPKKISRITSPRH